ncbi:DNA repair protein RAD51 homolog 4 isoform X2 [Amborella trichopoda]|uniref:DNA repair protein RAD51 homolog 4 isoform X2 n=1 Tax=Amborella trichopoda TaxID=13333 RepID=UPI0005D45494|nr:DNA repair protein RAD51 homolog 4 isoform X2 [Amborella trichopoda]|eukprot:XP_011623339.1 DNA repair protein RAD51 homolog 4 isoform X2 [Amborella trichopoda]
MPPLKSLQHQFPSIDSNLLHFCASHGIFSVEDFLVHDLYMLVALAERQTSSKGLKEGIAQVLTFLNNQHFPWMNGVELLESTQHNKHFLLTGFDGIDTLLCGGLCEGNLTELAGPSSSGKTQFCLHAAAHVAYTYMCSVLYLDTSNSFSSKRISYRVNRLLASPNKGEKGRSLEGIMSSILSHSVFDIFSMFETLHQLELSLSSQAEIQNSKLRLLIVDSISSLITPILGGKGPQGHSLMLNVGFILKKLAIDYNLAVLVTNHTVVGEGGNSKPALGESWKSVPHTRLLLSRDQMSNICNMSILKHTSMACGQTASFRLDG